MRCLGLVELRPYHSNHCFRDALQREFQRRSGCGSTAPLVSITGGFGAHPTRPKSSTFAEDLHDCIHRLRLAGANGVTLDCPDWFQYADDIVREGAYPLLDPLDALIEEFAWRRISPPATIGLLEPCETISNRLRLLGYQTIEGVAPRISSIAPHTVRRLLQEAARELSSRGADAILIPASLSGAVPERTIEELGILDLTALHAEACVRWMLQEEYSQYGVQFAEHKRW